MKPERWEQIERLYFAIRELGPGPHAAFLDQACVGDESLRLEVESLLASDEQAGDFLNTPALKIATEEIAEEQARTLVGRQLGHYRLLSQLGAGGMGEVYLAARADDQYRKQVAIKLVKRGMDTDNILRRFRHERQILAALDHPNIARLLDGGVSEDGLPYFVMEYIAGDPITEYCDSHQLSTEARLKLFRQVCAAVHYAHQNLVVHRDLKPGNILVTEEGAPRLLDFGIAKVFNPELASQTLDLTAPEMRLMTPEYASPEQVRGEPITTASDIYSLGVVLYELLTGHHPYSTRNLPPSEIIRIVCEKEPEKPSDSIADCGFRIADSKSLWSLISRFKTWTRFFTRNPQSAIRNPQSLQGDVDNIVLMALRKEPERRYGSVMQFSEDIRRHLEGLPVIARKDTLGYRSAKFLQRHKAGVAAAAAIVTLVIGAIAILIWERNAAVQARAEAFSRELAANAIVQLPYDPELSILLATEAMRVASTTQAEDALRQSLPEFHLQAVMRGHTGSVRSAVWSPDGKLVLTASYDHTARIWEALTGRCVAELHGHTDPLNRASFSPDGRLVVTASFDNTARLWETSTGRSLKELRGHTGAILMASFSPDGKLLVTPSYDKTARVWDVSTGQTLAILQGHTGRLWSAAFSPDGRLIVTTSEDGAARIWSARTWQSLARFGGHRSSGFASFSPDSKLLVTDSYGAVRVWDVRAKHSLATLRGHRNSVFSPDGRLVATPNDDGVARLWEACTGRLLNELRGHTSKIQNVAFSPNGEYVVTMSYDGTARIWEVSTGQCLKELRGHKGIVYDAAFSPDGKWVVTGGDDGMVAVWAVSRGGMAPVLRGHTGGLISAAFSPDGKFIVTGGKDNTARVWEASAGRALKELRGHNGFVSGVGFSPNGHYIVTASRDSTARIWAVDTGQSLKELHMPTTWVRAAAFSPDGQYLATAGGNDPDTVQLWEAGAGRYIRDLRGHTEGIPSVTFSPDGRLLLTASFDGTARIWEFHSGRCLMVIKKQEKLSSAAFSPDGKWVVTASQDGIARLWEASAGRSVRELRGHKAYVTHVAFSPDGNFIVTSSLDGTARVWEAETGRTIVVIRGHSDEVWSASFSPDGRFVVTASFDKTARIYACEVCRPIQEVLALARTRVTRSLTPEERAKYLHEAANQ